MTSYPTRVQTRLEQTNDESFTFRTFSFQVDAALTCVFISKRSVVSIDQVITCATLRASPALPLADKVARGPIEFVRLLSACLVFFAVCSPLHAAPASQQEGAEELPPALLW